MRRDRNSMTRVKLPASTVAKTRSGCGLVERPEAQHRDIGDDNEQVEQRGAPLRRAKPGHGRKPGETGAHGEAGPEQRQCESPERCANTAGVYAGCRRGRSRWSVQAGPAGDSMRSAMAAAAAARCHRRAAGGYGRSNSCTCTERAEASPSRSSTARVSAGTVHASCINSGTRRVRQGCWAGSSGRCASGAASAPGGRSTARCGRPPPSGAWPTWLPAPRCQRRAAPRRRPAGAVCASPSSRRQRAAGSAAASSRPAARTGTFGIGGRNHQLQVRHGRHGLHRGGEEVAAQACDLAQARTRQQRQHRRVGGQSQGSARRGAPGDQGKASARG